MIRFQCIEKAKQLPQCWDELADNYFQQKTFLSHAEKYNSCKQRYYLCYDDEKLSAGAIVYTLKLNLFTFFRFSLPIKMHIAGIPCSVSSQGVIGGFEAINKLKKHIYAQEKGFVLFLNLESKPEASEIASGNTLPSIILKNTFNNWDGYYSALRSPYRRRMKQILKTEPGIALEKASCSVFNEEMYQQYINVYSKSSDKLEKLTLEFFKNLPPEFCLMICRKYEKVIGWNIGLLDNDCYYFFLGGIDYTENRANDTYLRLLANIVKDGIWNNAKRIDLGQTAEIAKMRMGGDVCPLYMEAHHSSKVINKLLKLCSPLLSYKRKLENTKAFKK